MRNTVEAACKRFRGWGRAELAKLLKDEGVSQATVYAWFAGSRMASKTHIDMLCTLLGCSINDLYVTEKYQFKNKLLQEIAKKGAER